MNKKQKKMLIRIIVAAVLIVLFSKLPIDGYVRFGLFMIPYLVIGYDILQKAFKGIRNKQVFDENFLMAVATVGAILLGDYSEGVAVMLFYQIGELFQSYAVGKSRRNISELMDIRPDYANIEVRSENSENLPYPRFWNLWRIPVPENQNQRILFQSLPNIILRLYATEHLHLLLFLRSYF